MGKIPLFSTDYKYTEPFRLFESRGPKKTKDNMSEVFKFLVRAVEDDSGPVTISSYACTFNPKIFNDMGYEVTLNEDSSVTIGYGT